MGAPCSANKSLTQLFQIGRRGSVMQTSAIGYLLTKTVFSTSSSGNFGPHFPGPEGMQRGARSGLSLPRCGDVVRRTSCASRFDREVTVYRSRPVGPEQRISTHRNRSPLQGLRRYEQRKVSNGGAERNRTAGLVIANDALYQLSYGP